MPQSPTLGSGTLPGIPVTASSIGVVPPSPLTGTTVQDIIDELQAELTSGVFLTTTSGEGKGLATTTASGAALTLDLSTADTFDITLTANCTLTFNNPPLAAKDCVWTIILRQGGVGSFTVTWPGNVSWQNPTTGVAGGSAPTLFTAVNAVDVFEISTLDGGVSYGGSSKVATSFGTPSLTLSTTNAAGSAASAIRTDATVAVFDATTPASIGTAATGSAGKAARRDHVHATGAGTPTTQAFGDTASTGTGPAASMTDHVHGMPSVADVQALLGPQHAHVNNVTFSGDGSTTIFYLPVAPVDAYSIGVYVGTGRNNDWTLSGGILDVLTFGSPPTSGTDNISVDIAAAA